MTVGIPRHRKTEPSGSDITSDTTQLRDALLEARAQCDHQLQSEAPFRALQQLEVRTQMGDVVTAIDQTELRNRIAAQLEYNPVWNARQRIDEALGAITNPFENAVAADLEQPQPAVSPERPNQQDTSAQPGELVLPETPGLPEHKIEAVLSQPDIAPAAPRAPVSVHQSEFSADPSPIDTSNLTLINGITTDIAARLRATGITHMSDLATLVPSDVRRLSADLNLGTRIQRENWIEQAAVLGARKATRFVTSGRNVATPYTYTALAPLDGAVGGAVGEPVEQLSPTPETIQATQTTQPPMVPLATPATPCANHVSAPAATAAPQRAETAPKTPRKLSKRIYEIETRRRQTTYFTIPYQSAVEDIADEPVADEQVIEHTPAPQTAPEAATTDAPEYALALDIEQGAANPQPEVPSAAPSVPLGSGPAHHAPHNEQPLRTWAVEQTHAPAPKRTYATEAPQSAAPVSQTADQSPSGDTDRFRSALAGTPPTGTPAQFDEEAAVQIRTYDTPQADTPEALSYRLSEGRPEYATGSEEFFEGAAPQSELTKGYGAYHVEVEEASVEFRAPGTPAAQSDAAAMENRNLFIRRTRPPAENKKKISKFFQALTGTPAK